ncbi:tetratricopeptide repeat protein [Seonamhaeicola marinus]|uniref:Tetratricopeptide repeat protein n=1 Tax=Seonamhaeicola marinus TaxID=1912246 RepID=A0A5D0J9P1_9FLAO|nr:tetratricopeptide repeat protein [Seonamhaeicola marinus]TYA92286.1 tetratricopeptide repeat protein [Seonamhaeicola marinus]
MNISKFVAFSFLAVLIFNCKTADIAESKNKSSKSFYNDGLVLKEVFYNTKGHKDSLKTYHNTGKLNEVFYYKNNKYHGTCYQLNKKGDTLVVWQFQDGILKKRTDHNLDFNKINERSIKMAQSRLQESIKLFENDFGVYGRIEIARHRFKLKHYTLALDELLKLEKESLTPRSKMGIYEMLANIYSSYENEEAAIHYKVKAINVAAKKTRLEYNLAAYLLHAKSYNSAQHYFDIVLKTWPKHSFSHWTLGKYHSDKGEYEKALEHINIAYKQEQNIINYSSNTSFTDVKTIKGFIHHKLGDSKLGIQFLLKAIKEKPNNSYAYRSLGIIHSDLGEHAKACAYLKKSRELGYEKAFDKNDLEYYIMLSCNDTTIEKPDSTLIENELVDLNVEEDQNAIELSDYSSNQFEYQILNHNKKIIRKGSTENKIVNIGNLSSGYYTLKVLNTSNPKNFNFIRL